MSSLIAKNLQVGSDPTATNNFTIFQPATPDGTLRIGNGNTGITSSLLTLTSAGNLGIGTSSPAYLLDVAGTVRSTGAYAFSTDTFTYSFNGGTTGQVRSGIKFDGTNTLMQFYTAQSERMRLDSSGNLGLGVTPSAWSGSLLNSGAFQLGAGYGSLYAYSNAITLGSNVYYTSNGNKYFASGTGASAYQQIGGVHYWLTAPAGTAGNAITFTQAMTLDASGNLGVGTTSPIGKLNVSNGGASGFEFFTNYLGGGLGTYIQSYNRSTSAYMDTAYNAAMHAFFTSGSERARIDSSGNLLVGTTSQIFSGKQVNAFVGSTHNGIVLNETANTALCTYVAFLNTGTLIGSIDRVGSTSAVIYNTTSDYRLKTVIGPVADAGQRIDALQPVEYTWNSDGSRTRGFLAHQFQEVYAGSVTGSKDAVDADGKPVYQAMQASSSEVIADLVAEIQSLRARVAAIESN